MPSWYRYLTLPDGRKLDNLKKENMMRQLAKENIPASTMSSLRCESVVLKGILLRNEQLLKLSKSLLKALKQYRDEVKTGWLFPSNRNSKNAISERMARYIVYGRWNGAQF